MTYRQARQGALPEATTWMDRMDNNSSVVHAEKENSQISDTCARARVLLEALDNGALPTAKALDAIFELRDCDQAAASWRQVGTAEHLFTSCGP